MVRWSLVLAAFLALPGCNEVFDLSSTELGDPEMPVDLDSDGIPDLEDDCIASAFDEVEDFDRDQIPNGMDECPWDARPALGGTADRDADGLPDICDPFPDARGDRRRCTMRFYNPELNRALWVPRTGEQPFEPSAGFLVGSAGQSAIASVPVLPTTPSTTINLIGFASAYPADFVYRSLLRTGASASDPQLACEVRATSIGTTLALVGGDPGEMAGPALAYDATGFVVHAKLQPTSTGVNALCALVYDGAVLYVRRHVEVPPGDLGFAVTRGQVYVYSVAIYDRDDLQAL